MQAAAILNSLARATVPTASPSASTATGDFAAALTESLAGTGQVVADSPAGAKKATHKMEPEMPSDALTQADTADMAAALTAVVPQPAVPLLPGLPELKGISITRPSTEQPMQAVGEAAVQTAGLASDSTQSTKTRNPAIAANLDLLPADGTVEAMLLPQVKNVPAANQATVMPEQPAIDDVEKLTTLGAAGPPAIASNASVTPEQASPLVSNRLQQAISGETPAQQESPMVGVVELTSATVGEGRAPSLIPSAESAARQASQIPAPIVLKVEGKTQPADDKVREKLEAATAEAVWSSAPLPPAAIKIPTSGTRAISKSADAPSADKKDIAENSAVEGSPSADVDGVAATKTPRPAAAASDAIPTSRGDSEEKNTTPKPQSTPSLHEVAALASNAKDPGPPAPASNDSRSPSLTPMPASDKGDASKAHQLLDSAPIAASTAAAPHIVSDTRGDEQMRIGIRTSAFGAVEIYTSVHQNEVGLAVHGERGLSHWFGTEVQTIESGLKDHQLHLTTVDVDGGTRMQTATGSHQHPQHNFSPATDWRSAATLEVEPETGPDDIVTPVLDAGSGTSRVSIRV